MRRLIPGLAAIICLLALFQSCGPGRSMRESEAAPDWVRSRPVTPGYYTGIGWSQKTSNVHQYQQAAKQNALADMASEISVNISSNSVLHAFESNLGYREDFSSTIQASTREELEGFELADTWEDQGNYWIYYRLSASRHREIKERRKNDAAGLSLGFFESALENRDQGNIRMNIVQLINSMEAIRNYFDDPLPAEFKGRNIQLGNEIFKELSASVSRLKIEPSHREIRVKNGQEIVSSMLEFKVECDLRGPVTDFPLIASYSERPIRNNRSRTGSDGIAGFGIERVRSSKSFETFTVRADMESIIAEATNDPVIRRLVGRFPVPETTVRIGIEKPVIMLDAQEMALGQAVSGGQLEDSFRRNAIEGGYMLTGSADDADFIVRIKANAIPFGETGTYKNIILNGSIIVEEGNGVLIYHRELEGFRGSHFSTGSAVEEAYRQAARRLNSTFFREIDEALKKGIQRQN